MIRVWRICSARHPSAFDGEGARKYGGRFNAKGTAAAYASDSLSLSALEVLVHADASSLRGDYTAHALDLPDDVVREEWKAADLPSNWRDGPAPPALQALGNAWLVGMTAAVLFVPSAVVPEQRNVVINPAHADSAKLRPGPRRRFVFNPRLAR